MKPKECDRLLLSKNVRDNPSQRESFMQLMLEGQSGERAAAAFTRIRNI